MAVMVKDRAGFHTLVAQIPQELWNRLCAEAEADDAGGSATRVLIRVLAKHYKVALSDLPKPRRAGRKPRRL